MIARSTLSLPLVAALSTASAQTFDEAVWTNMTIAVQLCEGHSGPDMNAWAQSFRNAGFAERVDRSSGNSDTTHTFTAPADTVQVELYYGEMPEHCIVSSAHMGVTRASDLLDALIPQLRPGYLRRVTQGAPDPVTGQPATCARYEQPGSEIPHTIAAFAGGGSGGCVENGTSVISNFSAV